MNTIPKRRGGNPEREKRTQSPPPYLCTPSPLPTGEKHPAPAGFLIHQDARGGLRLGHTWTNTDTQSPRLASRAWRRGGCFKSTMAHTRTGCGSVQLSGSGWEGFKVPGDPPVAQARVSRSRKGERKYRRGQVLRPSLSLVPEERWMPRPLRSDETSLPCL